MSTYQDQKSKKYLWISLMIKKAYEEYKKRPKIYDLIRLSREWLSIRKILAEVKKIHWKGFWVWPTAEIIKEFKDIIHASDSDYNAFELMVKQHQQITKNVNVAQRKDIGYELEKAKIMIAELNNPNISESDKWRIADRWRRQVEAINEDIKTHWMPTASADWIQELFNVNWQILAKGSKLILDNITKLNPRNYKDLKTISEILDTAFKQNRLISGQSTERIEVSLNDLYDKIIENNQQTTIIEYKPQNNGKKDTDTTLPGKTETTS